MRNGTPTVERHSASWAVGQFTRNLEQPVSENLLFGVGRTAWYCLLEGQEGCRLMTYHPQRVTRMFMALNVPMDSYRDATRRPLTPADLRSGLLEVRRSALAVEEDGQVAPEESKLYCIWSRVQDGEGDQSGWPHVEIQTAAREQSTAVSGARVARAWRCPEARYEDFTVYQAHTPSVLWTPEVAVDLSIGQWVRQMREARSPWGISGIAALIAFADRLKRDPLLDFSRTRALAEVDGGCAGHRDQMAAFFEEAHDLLGEGRLGVAAAMCREIARLWRGLLSRSDSRQARNYGIAETVRHIIRVESDLVQMLEGRASA